MKIPRDIDDLIWDVAEQQSPELMDEFAARYPEYKGELVARIKMVRGLKGGRPKAAAVRPRFVPKQHVVEAKPAWAHPMTLAFAGTTLLLLGVLAGAYSQKLIFAPQPTPSVPVVQQIDAKPKTFPEVGSDPKELEQKTWIPQQAPANAQPQPPAQGQTAFDRRITIEADKASLSDVLEQVALKAGLRLQAAPGMPDIEIEAKYYDLPAMTVLNDLGRNFGFTPLKQTDSEALLIPAIDNQNPPLQAQNGFATAVDAGAEDGGSARPKPKNPPGTLPPATPLRGTIGR